MAVDTRHTTLSGGELTIDPTENVKALQQASAQRQDDLRQLNNERINAEIRILATQVAGIEKQLQSHTEHSKEVRQLETERVNAIRQVDVLAQNTAAERALVAIQTLASQTTAERETLRSLVTTSAATLAAQNAQDLARINEAISALQKSSYEGAGKAGVTDPAMSAALQKIEAIATAMAASGGQAKGQSNVVAYIGVGISILLGLLLLADRFGR